MASFAIKKDGTKVPFESGKIKASIMAAALEAGLSEKESTDIAEKVLSLVTTTFGGQEEVTTSEIKEKVLSELDTMAPAVSEAWRKYDQSMGK